MTVFDDVAADLDRMADEVDPAVDGALRKLAGDVADMQRRMTRRDTGATQRSISITRTDTGYEVGPEGDDATDLHQEFGTPHVPANPFVMPSADMAEARLVNVVGEALPTW